MNKIKAKYLLIVFSLCFIPTHVFPQSQPYLDSLITVLETTKTDSSRVNLLNDIAWELKVSDAAKARLYLDSSAQLSKKIAFKKGEAQAYNNRGVVETIDGKYDEAIAFYEKALVIRESLGDKKGVASLYNNIGNLLEGKNDYAGALENLQKSLRLRESLKDTLRIARVSYNLALVHEAMGDYPEALNYIFNHLEISERLGEEYEIANAENMLGNIKSELERFNEAEKHYLKALELREKIGDQWDLATTYNNIGNIKDDWGEVSLKANEMDQAFQHFQEALNYYHQSLRIYEGLEDESGQGDAFNNIGVVYKNIGSYYLDLEDQANASKSFKTAHQYLNQSLVIREKNEDRKGLMEVNNGIGDVYRRQQKPLLALKYTNEYLRIAEALNDHKFIQKAYKDLSRVYADIKDFEKAYEYRKAYDELRYERLDEDRTKQNSRREARFGDVKKQYEIDRQQAAIQLQNAELQKGELIRNSLIGGSVLLSILALLLYNRYRIKNNSNIQLEKKNQIIEKEKKRSEELLLNILPEATAEELKKHGKTKARYYDSVTVLFSDFESFTNISEELSAEELVKELDECFRAFDAITGKYNIEKIKTIGDAYMCAGGLPTPNKTHPVDVIKAAIEMQQFMNYHAKERQSAGKPVFKARIGIHTGPVVAGIVGSKKFAYDIWGDTVNLASRMESSGKSGKINISGATFTLIKDEFDCFYRGKVVAKKKGEIDMYFIEKSVSKTKVNLYT